MKRAALCLVVVACSHTPPLPPLPPQMTPEQRVTTYEALKPEDNAVVIDTRYDAGTLTLANGTAIKDPDALLPVMAPNSPGAASARTYARSDRIAMYTLPLGMLLAAGGGVVGIHGILQDNSLERRIGGWSFVAGFLVVLPIGFYFGFEARHARNKSFLLYRESLVQRLELCPQGTQMVPCETTR